jgi:hypothetical protein
MIRSEARDVDVDVAVVVEVRGGDTEPVHLRGEAGLTGDVGERSVVIVVIERRQ